MEKQTYSELSLTGLLRFDGDEAQFFLHNQLSCDVAGLAPGHSTYGAYCTAKGRMLASFLLWQSQQSYFMQLPSLLCEPIQKLLAKFILRSKVKVSHASGDWSIIGVAGKDAGVLVQRAVGDAPQGVHEVIHTRSAMVIRLPGDRYEIIATRDNTAGILDTLSAGANRADPEHWEWLEIRAGIPAITPATQEAFVPQMVNLDLIGGVSFEKGCYPGQEIVARMHYRGTLKQRMYLASVAGTDSPIPGDKLYSATFGDQACGTIINAARAPDGGYDLLASIQIASAEQGGVRWKAPAGPALKILPLPYQS